MNKEASGNVLDLPYSTEKRKSKDFQYEISSIFSVWQLLTWFSFHRYRSFDTSKQETIWSIGGKSRTFYRTKSMFVVASIIELNVPSWNVECLMNKFIIDEKLTWNFPRSAVFPPLESPTKTILNTVSLKNGSKSRENWRAVKRTIRHSLVFLHLRWKFWVVGN